MAGKVIVPAQVLEDLRALSETYGVDRRDYYALKDLSFSLGREVTHSWLHNNMKLFQQGVLYGMDTENRVPAPEDKQ